MPAVSGGHFSLSLMAQHRWLHDGQNKGGQTAGGRPGRLYPFLHMAALMRPLIAGGTPPVAVRDGRLVRCMLAYCKLTPGGGTPPVAVCDGRLVRSTLAYSKLAPGGGTPPVAIRDGRLVRSTLAYYKLTRGSMLETQEQCSSDAGIPSVIQLVAVCDGRSGL
ncbi:hypothetical protein BKA93DRAFT_754683 [Sparassis latifolia]